MTGCKLLDFRFGPYSRAVSWGAALRQTAPGISAKNREFQPYEQTEEDRLPDIFYQPGQGL